MAVGRMLTMDRFDLFFEHQVFARLLPMTIDILPVDAQYAGR
jgi:hypothetical protein